MGEFLSVIIAGIATGSAYALLALAVVIIFRSTDRVNFAIGDTGAFGLYAGLYGLGLGLPVAGLYLGGAGRRRHRGCDRKMHHPALGSWTQSRLRGLGGHHRLGAGPASRHGRDLRPRAAQASRPWSKAGSISAAFRFR